jgi:arylformamidase
VRQSGEFHGAWRGAGNRGERVAQAGAHHFTAIHGFEQTTSDLTQWLVRGLRLGK